MSIGDCPNWPNCGHKVMSQCDADADVARPAGMVTIVPERARHPLPDGAAVAPSTSVRRTRPAANLVADAGDAQKGVVPDLPVDFTTLGAAMRAIRQCIQMIDRAPDHESEALTAAVRRTLRGAVLIAEESGEELEAPTVANALVGEVTETEVSQALLTSIEGANGGKDQSTSFARCSAISWRLACRVLPVQSSGLNSGLPQGLVRLNCPRCRRRRSSGCSIAKTSPRLDRLIVSIYN